jgi:peptidoglycan/xylan/chitin deacetylase (PgdA/CDA1 family)
MTGPQSDNSKKNGFYLGGLAQSTLAHLPRARLGVGRVLVLCYHSIHPSHRFASASPAMFEEHLGWLSEYCNIIPFDAALRHVDTRDANPSIAITFDDGYVDNHTYVLPALVRHGIHATFFVATGFVERDPEVLSRLGRLWNVPVHELAGLSWTQVREIREAGMEIGAHTRSHPNLALLTEDQVRRELSESKDMLENCLGESVVSVAYPYGIPRRHITNREVNIASGVGFEHGAAILYRRVRATDNPLLIPRLAVTDDSLDMLQAKVIGKLDLVGVWQEHAPLWVSRVVSSKVQNRSN